MLQAYIPIAVPLPCDDYYIKELPTGLDELIFSISVWAEEYQGIAEETLIEDQEDGKTATYRVKAIDAGEDDATVKCVIDLDAWKSTVFVSYSQVGGTVAANVANVLPTGWTLSDQSSMTETADVAIDGGTALDVLEECRKVFDGASYRFDQSTKTVTIYDLYNGPNLGTFLTRELNLQSVQYKGKSTELVTRLYPYGKEGLSIAEVNSGLPYIDNFTYTDRVICAFWQDTSYEVASNLKDAAIAKLEELATPERSFTCSVADLAAIDPGKYSFLSFPLFSQVGLIDETRSANKFMHRVVERWNYPNYPEKNKVILSNAPRRIQVQVVEALKGPVNGNRISSGSIGSKKLGDDAVTVNKIKNGAVVTEKIANDAVTTDKVLNEAITIAKMWNDFQIFYSELVAAIVFVGQVADIQYSVKCSYLYVTSLINYLGNALSNISITYVDNQSITYNDRGIYVYGWGGAYTNPGGDYYE